MKLARSVTAAAVLLGACSAQDPEAISLLGEPLHQPPLAAAAAAELEAKLAEARAAWERDPTGADAIIWLGRRTAYLGRYREAIDIYTRGIEQHPDDPRLYRHRGHRFITVRRLDDAIADLQRAEALVEGRPDRIEPDGLPNERGIPTSTLHSNIHYHLALAHYLEGRFDSAAELWARARDAVANPDNLVAASHWLYLSRRRAGRDDAAEVLAPIHADLDVIENDGYHRLLLMYRGERDPEALLAEAPDGPGGAAVRYGVGAWYLLEGREEDARRLWREMVAGPGWAAFGHIAAEAELARADACVQRGGRDSATSASYSG